MSSHYWIHKHHFWCLNNSSPKLLLKFLPTENPHDPRPKLTTYLISTSLLPTFVLGSTIVSIHLVVMIALNDWITSVPIGCLRVSATIASNTFGEVMLTLIRRCSNLWLSIGILYGAKCGCEYISGSLLLIWTYGQICRLCNPNWLPNSMLLSL